ncbi:hypothetical protein ACJJTC_015799 [Scirpophaga incertulas]
MPKRLDKQPKFNLTFNLLFLRKLLKLFSMNIIGLEMMPGCREKIELDRMEILEHLTFWAEFRSLFCIFCAILIILPYVITWDGLVTKYHKKYRKEIGIQPKTEAYIQSLVLKKTLECISLERRRGLEEDDGHNEGEALVSKINEMSTGGGTEPTQ